MQVMDHKSVIVGYGNPYCGDDGVGPAAARLLHAAMDAESGVALLELSGSALDLVERLAGYERAIIIDALVDEQAPVGTVMPLELAGGQAVPRLGFHTAGLGSALELARAVGMEVPAGIRLFGIVIREPREFRESLSAELQARLPQIVREVAAHA
jgi:hydrogenase maturation protease